jgi:Domain of unknown function DUF29
MAGRVPDNEAHLAPKAEPVTADYSRDFYSWSIEQAHHLRAGRWNVLDRVNLADEIESLGREQFNKLESALRVLIVHMLKWDHQPDRRGRSWWATIGEQRVRIEHILADNPGLRPRIEEAISRADRTARLRAVKETDIDDRHFPQTCPYSWQDIVSREFSI